MKIFLAVLALLNLFGMFGEPDSGSRKNYAFAFVATIFGIVSLYVLDWMVLTA